MSGVNERFLFAAAPDSWGVLDYPGPSWEQSYEKMIDEMVEAGYTGTELGPYGFSVVEQDVKFGHTAISPKDSVEASLKYLRGVVNQLGTAAKA